MDVMNIDGANGNEAPGFRNDADLVDECAKAMRDGEKRRLEPQRRHALAEWNELEPDYRGLYRDLTGDVIAVLRRRGLLTAQALELLQRDGDLTPL